MKIILPTFFTYEMISPEIDSQLLNGLNGWLMTAISAEPESKGPVTRDIGYRILGNPRASKAEAIAALPIVPGDPSPLFAPMDAMTQEGSSLLRGPAFSEMTNITDPTWRTIPYLVLIVLCGGDVENLTVAFEVDDLDQPVPNGFPQRLDLVSEDPLTWQSWGGPEFGHGPIEVGGKSYRFSNYGQAGTPLKASEWVPAYLQGQKVITVEQLNQLRDEAAAAP